jgi:hypothetical protein
VPKNLLDNLLPSPSFPARRFSFSRRCAHALVLLALAAAGLVAHAQVEPSAYKRGLAISAGGEVSAFQPDYAGFGVPQTSTNRLYGIGAYVDVKFTNWIQIEAEGRWLHFNQFDGINENSYLIGPRLPIEKLRYKRITPYGKFLFGDSRLNFENNAGWGRYTTLAYGGGLDIKMTRKLALRVPDFEYQQWLDWSEGTAQTYTLQPYGVSAGVTYKIFGGR